MLVNKCHLGRSILPLDENVPDRSQKVNAHLSLEASSPEKVSGFPGDWAKPVPRGTYGPDTEVVSAPRTLAHVGGNCHNARLSRISAEIIFIPHPNNSRIQKLKTFFFWEINFFLLNHESLAQKKFHRYRCNVFAKHRNPHRWPNLIY